MAYLDSDYALDMLQCRLSNSGAGGAVTVLYTGDDIVFSYEGNDTVNGNLGNDTVYGGNGNDIVRGGQQNDLLLAENGNDALFGDRGDDTLTGGSGGDVFYVFSDGGIDYITDYNLTEDVLAIQSNINNTGITSKEQALAAAIQVQNDVHIALGSNTTVVLQGISLGSLNADDFVVV